jgi:hypothetical protein
MYRIFKTIHLLGLTLFLGSVFGHIVAGQTVGAQGASLIAARTEIVAATRLLTIREHGFGAFNVVLTLLLVILGVFKPKWARRTRAPS